MAHDIALLFATQGVTAFRNTALYQACRRMVDNLHGRLKSRAVFEHAKGILHAQLGTTPEGAFRVLSRFSQNTNEWVRVIAARGCRLVGTA